MTIVIGYYDIIPNLFDYRTIHHVTFSTVESDVTITLVVECTFLKTQQERLVGCVHKSINRLKSIFIYDGNAFGKNSRPRSGR